MDIEEAFPPGTVVTMRTGTVVLVTAESLVDEVMPCLAAGYHAVYGAPVGETAEIAVIYKHIDLQLATEMIVVVEGLLGIVAVDGIELNAALTTPVDSLIEQFSFANAPKDQSVMVGDEHPQGLHGKGFLLAYLRITVLDNGSVEIDCNQHNYFLMLSSSLLL